MKNLHYILLGIVIGAVVGFIGASTIDPGAQAASARFDLDCERYNTADEYLQCEQAKWLKDMAETAKRIEKNMPF